MWVVFEKVGNFEGVYGYVGNCVGGYVVVGEFCG